MRFYAILLAALFIAAFAQVEARSVEKRASFSEIMGKAKGALKKFGGKVKDFLKSALSKQIAVAREDFVSGLAQLQVFVDEQVGKGVNALAVYIPGLQGIVAERIGKVSDALDKYIEQNAGKLDEVRRLLLENAQKTLHSVENRLAALKPVAEAEQAVDQIVDTVAKVEDQANAEASEVKTRSNFAAFNGLKKAVEARLEALKQRMEDFKSNMFKNINSNKVAATQEQATAVEAKIEAAAELPTAEKVEVVKEAAAQLDITESAVNEIAQESA